MTYDEYCKKRDAKDLTDNAVAQLSGVSKSTISLWKNGKISPSKKTIKRLELFFEVYDPSAETYTVKDIMPDFDILAQDSEPIKQTFWIESFNVRINDGRPLELTERQFNELRSATEIFAETWLRTKGLIKRFKSPFLSERDKT